VRVAFYGGSFDPPHIAHVLAVAYLIALGEFDRVLVVPVLSHAFGKQLAPYEDRLRMCEAAMGWLPNVEISATEKSLGAPSRTRHTLRHLQREHPDFQLRLVVGADVLDEAKKWHAFDEVCKTAPLFVLGRVGYERPEAGPQVLPAVSATEVRRLLLQRADPHAEQRLRALVPARVLAYIDEHGLYRG
jgi:nicotinate-nucleotide adenylyltransferase